MERFAHEHPWMTLLLALAAVNGIVVIVRGYNPILTQELGSVKKVSVADKVSGLFGIPGQAGGMVPSTSVGALFGGGFAPHARVNQAVWGRI